MFSQFPANHPFPTSASATEATVPPPATSSYVNFNLSTICPEINFAVQGEKLLPAPPTTVAPPALSKATSSSRGSSMQLQQTLPPPPHQQHVDLKQARTRSDFSSAADVPMISQPLLGSNSSGIVGHGVGITPPPGLNQAKMLPLSSLPSVGPNHTASTTTGMTFHSQ